MRSLTLLLLLAACKPPADDTADDTGASPEPSFTSCPEGRDPRFDALAKVVDAEREDLGAPGLAVAVLLDGELAWCEGFGSRTPAGDEPMGAETLMRMGSVNKVLTAIGALQEVEAGTLSLDAPLPDLLGEDWTFALDETWAPQLTLHHLLTHQGGMVDYLSIDGPSGNDALSNWVDGWMLRNLYLMAPPGSFFNYSNPNFSIAGRLIEHGSGQYYVPRMQEGVFAPLGMDRTVFRPAQVLSDGDYAVGQTWDWTGATSDLVEAGPDAYDNAWARPAGYAWTSVEDLGRLAAFLMHGNPEVLTEGSRQALMSSQVDALGVPELDSYGYGLFVQTGIFLEDGFHAFPWVTHNGAIPGFSAEMHVMPEQGFALITLANGDGVYLRDTLAEALKLIELPPVSDGPDLTPPDPADYVGHFYDPWNVGPWTFSLDEGGQLVMDMPLLDQHGVPYEPEVVPLHGNTFLIRVQGIWMDVTFVPEEGGDWRWARTRYFVGEREEPLARVGSAPNPERLQRILRERPPVSPAIRVRLPR